MEPNRSEARIIWLDFLKAIAIFMMIAVHCTDNVTPAERSEHWYNLWGSLYGSLMRPAIPLFVMVTGALLLPVRENLQDFYRRRIPRIVIPFIIWSIIYNLFPWFTGVLGLSPTVINDFFAWAEPSQEAGDAIHNILMIPLTFSPFAIQMWYVYVLIGLYLYLPIFSAWVKQADEKQKQLFLILWFISLFIPYIRQYVTDNLWGTCSWNEFSMLYYFAGFNGYLLLGNYLAEKRREKYGAAYWTVLAIMFITGYSVTFSGFKTITAIPGQPESLVELFYTYCSPNVLLMTVPVFLAAKHIRFPSVIGRLLSSISRCTLGIWMSHYLFLGPCYMLVSAIETHTMVKMILCSIMLMCISCVSVYLVRKTGKAGRAIMG